MDPLETEATTLADQNFIRFYGQGNFKFCVLMRFVLSRFFGNHYSNPNEFCLLPQRLCDSGLSFMFVLNTSEVPRRCKCLF